ncbi:MAG TPA: DUF1330 domain-containing protein [Cellvibrionaceae bacterium]
MNKGYWIVRADVSDTEKFAEYASLTAEAITKYSGEFIIRAGKSEVVEGSSRSRNTVIQFPSYADALNCWQSIEYHSIKKYRYGAAELDVVIIEGCL